MDQSTTKGERRERKRRRKRYGMVVGGRPDLLRPMKLPTPEINTKER